MVDLNTIDLKAALLIGGALVGLVIISRIFNGWIDRQADIDPQGGYAGVYTVLGVSYTLMAALFILVLLLGVWPAALVVGVLLICFAASGIPMLLGDMARAGRKRRDEAERQRIERLNAVTFHHDFEETEEK